MSMRQAARPRQQVAKGKQVESESSEEEELQSSAVVASEEDESAEQLEPLHEDTRESTAQRRQVTKKYRELIEKAMDERSSLIRPDSDRVGDYIATANRLFPLVTAPREAALDSKLFTIMANVGNEQASRLQAGVARRDPADFITKVKKHLVTQSQVVDDEEENSIEVFDWSKLGEKAIKWMYRAPTAHNMLGPLGTLPIERKERRKTVREKIAQQINPESIASNREKTQEEVEQDAQRRVKIIGAALQKQGKKVNYFRFLMDPSSFNRSVENVFHFAFLIKDGHASVTIEDDEPFVCFAQPPLPEDYNSGRGEKKQCVVGFDHATWQATCEVYHITSCMIPHEGVRVESSATSSQMRSQGRSSQVQVEDYESQVPARGTQKRKKQQRMESSSSSSEEEMPVKKKKR
ncbi:non-structural maintenance of chromosomes element 4 protein [Planoprotostelium fungivorum]|uniref:Non-structural maintenance of chromosomes element 4 n=1 Tax=Planoprotostelium fungivorum TaxID=1890364 RepID=A0A2P6NXA3_9EUKA|nr:non-structural maintenance of chromosomes element 4 protein [Planoprotostelium fungivorum]